MRRNWRTWGTIATLTSAIAAAAMLVAPATAGPPVKGIDQVGGSEEVVGFCGGPTVLQTWSLDGRWQINTHGDGLEYYLAHGTWRETNTNVANGKTVTSVSKVMEKDKSITVNPDGSLTVIVLATGNATLYGPNGKAIARNPGQVRFVLEIATDGSITRGDTVKGSTGRTDDFCTAALAALA